jgi:hypothetical protein
MEQSTGHDFFVKMYVRLTFQDLAFQVLAFVDGIGLPRISSFGHQARYSVLCINTPADGPHGPKHVVCH